MILPTLSIIVPIYNQTQEVANIVDRALAQIPLNTDVSHELILLDNGSKFPCHPPLTEGRYDPSRISSIHKEPDIIRRTVNSIAGAWNQGAEKAQGQAFCFLNDDCFVQPGWAKPLVECALSGPNIACPWTNDEKSDGVGITGWCFVMSRNTFLQVGPFDEMFGPYFWEDTDWFHRAVLAGVRLLSVPASRVQHQRRTTCNTLPKSDWLFMANRYRFAWKHGLSDPGAAPAHWRSPLDEWPGAPPARRRLTLTEEIGIDKPFRGPGGF